MAVQLSKATAASGTMTVPPAWALTVIAIVFTTGVAAVFNYFTAAREKTTPAAATATGERPRPTSSPAASSNTVEVSTTARQSTPAIANDAPDRTATTAATGSPAKEPPQELSDEQLLVDSKGESIQPPPRSVDLEEVEWLEQLLRSHGQAK